MNRVDFRLRGEFVELCNLLKLAGVADSGGQGKALVASGEVRVMVGRKAARRRRSGPVRWSNASGSALPSRPPTTGSMTDPLRFTRRGLDATAMAALSMRPGTRPSAGEGM